MKTKNPLPADILPTDIESPRRIWHEDGSKLTKAEEKTNEQNGIVWELGSQGSLTLHFATGFGWVLATLPIGSGRGHAARTYATRLSDGATCRVGAGPHVAETVTIWLRKGRIEALKKYIDLYAEGMGKGNAIRDRISTRRAQGQEHRAMGHTRWSW